MSVLTHLPLAPLRRRGGLDLDPHAREDDPWTDEELLLAADDEDYVGFLRTLWLALVVCALLWIALAFGAIELFGIAGA